MKTTEWHITQAHWAMLLAIAAVCTQLGNLALLYAPASCGLILATARQGPVATVFYSVGGLLYLALLIAWAMSGDMSVAGPVFVMPITLALFIRWSVPVNQQLAQHRDVANEILITAMLSTAVIPYGLDNNINTLYCLMVGVGAAAISTVLLNLRRQWYVLLLTSWMMLIASTKHSLDQQAESVELLVWCVLTPMMIYMSLFTAYRYYKENS